MCDLERECYSQNTCQLGRELLEWNNVILKHMVTLKEQKDELDFIIKKQEDELQRLKEELEEKANIEKKYSNASEGMIHQIEVYDKVVKMLEDGYGNLVDTSEGVAQLVSQEVNDLEQLMDKKTSTEEAAREKLCDCKDLENVTIRRKDRRGCCVKPDCPRGPPTGKNGDIKSPNLIPTTVK
ncbi:unnamed protein product [Brassicogethes aeneus]|uniref:Uncharacterized protein n=1 Tax=Brassicogethes aeneus TaxID=1431903 RepID=A0A9P0FJH9_BRAAE|nr:unnamed protein product [Brassicogethes aeneus]